MSQTGQNEQGAWVLRVLGVTVEPTQTDEAPRPQGAAVRLARGMLLWNGVRSQLVNDLRKLQQAIIEQSADEPDFDDIKANIGNLEIVLEHLDDRLTDKLNALRDTDSADKKAALSREARDIVREYQAYCDTDPLMNALDDNGFVELDAHAKIKAALAAMLTTI